MEDFTKYTNKAVDVDLQRDLLISEIKDCQFTKDYSSAAPELQSAVFLSCHSALKAVLKLHAIIIDSMQNAGQEDVLKNINPGIYIEVNEKISIFKKMEKFLFMKISDKYKSRAPGTKDDPPDGRPSPVGDPGPGRTAARS